MKLVVSTWREDGHIHSTSSAEASLFGVGAEAADCGGDVSRGSVGCADCAIARSKRQSGIQLAQAVSSGATGRPGWEQTVARTSHRGGYAAAVYAGRPRFDSKLSGHDSHPVAGCASVGRRECGSWVGAGGVGVSGAMIGPPANTQIWIAAGVTDLRRGFTGLSALVQTKLEQTPLSGQVFVFRGGRGDLIKLLWYDGDGLCLFSKRLERGRFVWPQATSGTVSF